MSIKLVTIDLDGTLLNSHHMITDGVKEAIHYALNKGVHIVLATGRPFSGIAPYLKILNLENEGQFCISNNGSIIHDCKSGKHLIAYSLSFDDYLKIEQLSRNVDISMHALANNKMFTANECISHYTIHDAYLTHTPLIFRTVDKMDSTMSFNKIMLCGEPMQLDLAEKKIPADFFEQYCMLRSTPFFLECLHRDASKGNAMMEVAKKLNITQDEIMSIGDQNNDLPMFKYAKYKIAMGNAIGNVKNEATFITSSNDEDGVAVAIKKFI